MSDQGLDFGARPPRRESKRFEPPPWEREEFERQARERAQIEAANEAELARNRADRPTEPEDIAAAAELTGGGGPATAVGPPAREVPGVSPGAVKGAADERQVELLMLGLRAEEPAVFEGAWAVNLVAGGVLVLVGTAISIWGGAALARQGLTPTLTLGGLMLLAFGLAFLGMGVWLIFGVLRQRGVL